MKRDHSTIGFAIESEGVTNNVPNGKWTNTITERIYPVDIKNTTARYSSGDKINDDFVFTNKLSILIDPFIHKNYKRIIYATYLGIKWKVSSAEIKERRVYLNLGAEYNGQ